MSDALPGGRRFASLSSSTLGGVPLETYLATLFVARAVAIAALAGANYSLDPTAGSEREMARSR